VVSYTTYLSTTVGAVTAGTDTLSFSNAPDWYAPALPRPVADVGWQFEEMGQDVRKRYSITHWGAWVAQVLALPIQFIKGLRFLTEMFSPFGLMLAWLLIMFPVVLVFRELEYLKDLIIRLINILWEIVKFVISFIPGVG